MWRKIIDDSWLYYLNDLLEIKLIFLRSNCMFQLPQFVWALRSSV